MEINKAVMTLDGNDLKLSVPFAKVDAARRTVSGFATLDNVDQAGDVVTAEASAKAFARFRGNLREMHAPIAVGKVLDFSEEEFYDPKSDKTYRGVFVSAYVSKGAEDTWQKVLDGTLSGFSIGGKVLDAETEFDKSLGHGVQFIKDYQLVELSLVDSPCNQLANIFAISKRADGADMIKGMAVDVQLENILYCKNDSFAITTVREAAECAVCSDKMTNIGWVESSASDKVEKIRDAVAKQTVDSNMVHSSGSYGPGANGTITTKYMTPTSFTSSTAGGYTINITLPTATGQVQETINKTLEGGVDMSEKTAEQVAEEAKAESKEFANSPAAAKADEAANVEEVAPTEEAPAVEETVDEAAKVDEVENEEIDLAKMFEGFAKQVTEAITSSKEETAELVKSVKTDVDAKVSALETQVSELTEKFGAIETGVTEVAKRVDSVESDTAIKKSASLGGESDKIEKSTESIWGGRFLSASQIIS